MTIADELHSLDQLQQGGKLTAEEFAKAKQLVLSHPTQAAEAPVMSSIERQLETIRVQNELAQLDREWQQSIPTYEFTGRYGQRFLPNVLSGMIYLFVGGSCGLLWAIVASYAAVKLSPFSPLDWLFYGIALFAALFAFGSVVRAMAHFIVSSNYVAALNRYQSRRDAAVARLPKSLI